MKDDVWKIGVLSLMTLILIVILGVAISVQRLPSRIVNVGIDTYKVRQEEWEKNYATMQADVQKKFSENGAAKR